MKRVISWNMVTVDGFFAAPDGSLDWFVFEDDLDKYIKETQPQADTLLFGRVTYEMMASYWPTAEGEIATFMNGAPKYVFSRTLDKAGWNKTTLIKADAVDAVKKLKQQSGKDIYVFGSADFSATLQRHGLIDEYRIGVNPVILGRGIPLFKASDARLKLKLIHSRTLKSGVVIMHYEPA
jgi:dihydrofolate reductase